MATALTLSTTNNRAVARAPRRVNPGTHQFQQLAANWAGMDGAAKSSWYALAQKSVDGVQPQATPSGNNAYSAFVATNTNLQNSGQAAMTTAPDAHIVPPSLPAMSVAATFGHLGLLLHLSAATAYDDAVLIYAARPQLSGSAVYTGTRFVLIGSLPSLNSADITALFLSKYRIPSAGYQIALKVAPVSATGYRRPRTIVTGVVTAVTGLELG